MRGLAQTCLTIFERRPPVIVCQLGQVQYIQVLYIKQAWQVAWTSSNGLALLVILLAAK